MKNISVDQMSVGTENFWEGENDQKLKDRMILIVRRIILSKDWDLLGTFEGNRQNWDFLGAISYKMLFIQKDAPI